MAVFIYNLFLLFYGGGIRLASLFNSKAKRWVNGRKQIFIKLKKQIGDNNHPLIWMHCSSLGEFEQGRPVLEALKNKYPTHKILLSFFSPSGYETQKNYPQANIVSYLPLDSASHAKKFIALTRPSLVIFVKYEFWFYYLREINRNHIPLILISGVFRKGQPFFRWYGSLHRQMLGFFNQLFVQDDTSEKLLSKIGFKKITTIAGDTRFDRVLSISKKFEPIPYISEFCCSYQVIVAGSTWPEDEKEIQQAVAQINNQHIKLIIAPHEITKSHLDDIKKMFPSCIFYSDFLKNQIDYSSTVLIIDNVGLLSRLYYYASIGYVGGGFTKDGIHNILEAAVFYKPVIFGPNYKKYREAVELIEVGGAISFSKQPEEKNSLAAILTKIITEKEFTLSMSKAAGNYIQENTGASEKILTYIQENRLLTR